MIISSKHLLRDLRIFGGIALVFAFILWRIDFLLALPVLANSIIFFILAAGISKKEKWAWFSGIIIFIFLILSNLTSFFLGLITSVYLVIFLIIPTLFLITFIQARKEIVFENKISIILLILLVIGLIVNISSTVYLSSDSYEQKQKESRQEQLYLQLCQTMACYSAIKEEDGKFYYDYLGKKFDSREGCINYCVEILRETGVSEEEIEVPEEKTIDETAELVPSKVEGIEGWEVYRNEEYGFSFNFPKDFVVKGPEGTPEETPLLFSIQPIEKPERFALYPISMAFYNLVRYSFDKVLNNYNITYSNGEFLKDGLPLEEINIGGQTAIAFEQKLGWIGPDYKDREMASYKIVIFRKGNYTYVIQGIEDFESVFNQILSTFRFLE